MPFLQGGEKLILKYRSDMSEINEAIAELEKKSEWIGIPSDKEAEDHGISFGSLEYDGGYMLPDDFTIYVIESKPYKSDDWNHGLSLIHI